uniref:retina-specific copper amine oxidase-like n=1 Tax=Euleptes europaea TaxID=460621 RepID=UPI0025417227|nr:retina-specific copper amine oxidase-like [Euleptes europaea]
MNLKTVLLWLLLVLVAVLALVCILLLPSNKHTRCDDQMQGSLEHPHSDQSWIFADLTQEEMNQVMLYLKSNLGVRLEDASHASPSDNCIYSIDLQLPPKAESLLFLDHGGSRPLRQALVVVYFGNQPDPNVTEYVVSPLPEPTYHQDVTRQKYGGHIPYYRRPLLDAEYKQMTIVLHNVVFPTAPNFMQEVLNYDGNNLAAMITTPHGLKSGDRATWLVLFQNVTGYFLHPVGLEVLLDHSSLYIYEWTVKEVFYNGHYYRDMAQLEREFMKGHAPVEMIKRVPVDGVFSSLKPRVQPAGSGPFYYEPSGPRYSVRNNQVVSSAWSFAYRMDISRGLRLFDIRFRGHRIVYELSVQDAMSIYGSNSPGGMSTRYMDGSFGIGRLTHSLVQGIDCPYSATYLDVYSLAQAQKPTVTRDALCVFEQAMGTPLRRHYSRRQLLYYGGLPATALILRSVATMGNYDYIWDFVFHPNGAIESKVQATGYISSSFLYGDGLDYGNRVGDRTLGTIHTHSIGYKVDLDVGDVQGPEEVNDARYQDAKRIHMDTAKVEAMLSWQAPQNRKDVQRFLGFTNHYRQFIPGLLSP